ncbi:DivIVA domain-containing protein [Mycobacterium innocens]|uniref:DivIVA domain-containing protein n=1 Tax=Mycobacterium innocens TaxID=2341083 RepID=UPI001FC95475|nr:MULTISPECIES: DivIVA domain-containing protein [Mycobacterium]
MTTFVNDPAPKFERTRNGYDPAAVNQYLAELMVQRQAQHYETERLRVEIAALRDENAVLRDTSPSAPAVTDRLAKMLRFAVDEVFQMQSEARAEASALIAAAKMTPKRLA